MDADLDPLRWLETAPPLDLHLLAACYERVLQGSLHEFLAASDEIRRHTGPYLRGLDEATALLDRRAEREDLTVRGLLRPVYAAAEAACWARLARTCQRTFPGYVEVLQRPWRDALLVLSLRHENPSAAAVLEALMRDEPAADVPALVRLACDALAQ